MPFDEAHYFDEERLARELSITRFNVYQFQLYHKREPLYFPTIESALKKANVPDDFKYLAVAESGLRNDAISDKNAGGIWQIIPDTGREIGLVINDEIDQRYDFEKSTIAVAKYLQTLYGQFHSWTLVAAAYNRGSNGLSRALTDQNVTSYYDLYLNEETSRYIFRILAIKYLMEHRNEVFSSSELGDQFVPPKTKTVDLATPVDLRVWAHDHHVPYGTFKELNPWIIGDTVSKGTWQVKILDQ